MPTPSEIRAGRAAERRELNARAERLLAELIVTIKRLSEIEPAAKRRSRDVWRLTDEVRSMCSDLLDAADVFKGETGCPLCGG